MEKLDKVGLDLRASRAAGSYQRALPRRLAATGLLLAACWPTGAWYVARVTDGSDEPWGVVALLAAMGFAVRGWRERSSARRGDRLLVGVAIGAALWLAARIWLSPLFAGAALALALAWVWADRRCWVGHAGLFLLSLPLLSSLQFYGGYPVRWLVGKLSSWLLSVVGQAVTAEGAVLRWRGEQIVIDAPCSGLQMMWSSAFFACLLICVFGLRPRRSFALLQAASVVTFAANVLRNCLLFFTESGQIEVGSWAHEAIGIGVFVFALGTIGVIGRKLRNSDDRNDEPERLAPSHSASGSKRAFWGALVAACLVVAGLSIGASEGLGPVGPIRPTGALHAEVVARLEKEGWRKAPLDEKTAAFVAQFPGSVELFAQRGRWMVVRLIERATRRYHPVADCFRALGYDVSHEPIGRRPDGSSWGRTMARKKGVAFEAWERVVAADGQAWTDASSWFWSAAIGSSKGPWVAYTEIVPVAVDE